MNYHVHIVSTPQRDRLSTGVTNNIAHCIAEQGSETSQLVYFETYDRMELAHAREAMIKHSERERTVALVEEFNPDWDDLYSQIRA